jgi:hypothetical protein
LLRALCILVVKPSTTANTISARMIKYSEPGRKSSPIRRSNICKAIAPNKAAWACKSSARVMRCLSITLLFWFFGFFDSFTLILAFGHSGNSLNFTLVGTGFGQSTQLDRLAVEDKSMGIPVLTAGLGSSLSARMRRPQGADPGVD